MYILHFVERRPLKDALTKIVNDANQSLRWKSYSSKYFKMISSVYSILKVWSTWSVVTSSGSFQCLKKDCYIDWIQVIVILYCIKTLFALNTLKIYLQIISFPTYFSSIFLISPLTCLTWSIKRFAFVFPQNANDTLSIYHHSITYHIFMCYHFVGYVLPNVMQDPHPSALAFGIYTALDFDYSY